MAHLKLFRDEDGTPRVFLNGLDLTAELFVDGLRITSTGDTDYDEVCIELKLGCSRIDIGEHENVDAALLVGASVLNTRATRGAA